MRNLVTANLIISSCVVFSLAPLNEYLGTGIWPIAQHDNYAQASSNASAPTAEDTLTMDTLMNSATQGALTVLYSSDNKVIWGRSAKAIFKVDRSGESLRLLDAVSVPTMSDDSSGFRGIYSFLTKDDRFYTSVGSGIFAYENKDLGDSFSNITFYSMWRFNEARSSESILSVSLTFDGKVVFLTNKGVVGIHNLDLNGPPIAWTRLGNDAEVSNSMAVDEHGGIYVVTSEYMYRLWWDSQLQVLHVPTVPNSPIFGCEDVQRHCSSYMSTYPIEEEKFVTRPTQKGSGTTPSLMKDDATGDIYCVIADGARQQSVVVFDGLGRIAASALVDFQTGAKESYTEQSILIHKNRLVVVQNAITPTGSRLVNLMKNWNLDRIISQTNLPEWVVKHYLLLPVALGDSPFGYQQFEFDAATKRLFTRWTNSDSGCPNSIPTYSEATNLMYCVSRSASIDNPAYPTSGFKGAWTVEALSWDTGKRALSFPVGTDFRFNTFYAACQVGANREIIFGSIGGIVRVSPAQPGARPRVARKINTNPWVWAVSRFVGGSVRA